MLMSDSNLIRDVDTNAETGLHMASKKGYVKIVTLLLESGANPNARDCHGRTAFYLACK